MRNVVQNISIEGVCGAIRGLNMEVLYIPVKSVAIQQHNRATLGHTNNRFIKESNIHVSAVSIRQQHLVVLRNIKKMYIMASNIPVTTVNIGQQKSVILKSI